MWHVLGLCLRAYAGISWGPLLSHSGALAIGPHVTDPRSGETLDADIVIDSGWLNIYLSRDSLNARPVQQPALTRMMAGASTAAEDAMEMGESKGSDGLSGNLRRSQQRQSGLPRVRVQIDNPAHSFCM